ncbi:uncharacterized protein LOC123541183 [Mercenaria mercenaria]|uniref:uncharacterized protein LOC123541183 n=1 Tax=Mercenaria mercenaria TaxID=6596 RepID=UPI00234F04A4|nr:uncharacterized protein LOC123541183 [Mercenaria mercenaria]
MEQIDTVSKVVDEAYEESKIRQKQRGVYLLKTTASSNDEQIQAETSLGTKELTLAVVHENEIPQETQAYQFDNPVFDNKDVRTGHGRMSFADVVMEIMPEPIKGGIHPFGRSSFYRASLGGEQSEIHREEGTLFLWALVTIIVLGVAVGIIVMSQMYQAKKHNHSSSVDSSTNWNATEY